MTATTPTMAAENTADSVRIRYLGRQPYVPVWEAMQRFTAERQADAQDELWVVEHDPVYTQGQAGKAEHVLAPGDIPVVQVDRGGQVTYHGPGQLVVYVLVNLRRRNTGIRDLVTLIEHSIIEVLAQVGIDSYARSDAPGVYVDEAKIAALGLRVRRGCSFHGLSFNLDMDLEPFTRINPCGYQGMAVTQVKDLLGAADPDALTRALLDQLVARLGYTSTIQQPSNNSVIGVG